MQQSLKCILALGLSLLISSCSKSSSEQKFSFENSSPEVHYEPVNQAGEFVDHKIVQDPMRDSYEKGQWEKSNESSAQTMGTESSVANRVNIVFIGDGYTFITTRAV